MEGNIDIYISKSLHQFCMRHNFLLLIIKCKRKSILRPTYPSTILIFSHSAVSYITPAPISADTAVEKLVSSNALLIQKRFKHELSCLTKSSGSGVEPCHLTGLAEKHWSMPMLNI